MKKCCQTLYKHRRNILDAVVIAILMIGSLKLGFLLGGRDTALWKSIVTAPVPETCALCGNGNGTRYHAPCLVNLSSGEVGELRVYDSHPDLPGNLAPIQQTGTFSFLRCAGIIGYRDTSMHMSHATLPKETAPIDPSHFCHSCRALLAESTTKGYILMDLYNLNHIQAYPIVSGQQYAIRDYTVSITQEEPSTGPSITVQGHLLTQ